MIRLHLRYFVHNDFEKTLAFSCQQCYNFTKAYFHIRRGQ